MLTQMTSTRPYLHKLGLNLVWFKILWWTLSDNSHSVYLYC